MCIRVDVLNPQELNSIVPQNRAYILIDNFRQLTAAKFFRIL